jgi:hypothetical protein
VPVTFDPDSDPIVMRASGSLAVRDSIEAMDQIVAHTGGAAIHRNVLFMLDVTVGRAISRAQCAHGHRRSRYDQPSQCETMAWLDRDQSQDRVGGGHLQHRGRGTVLALGALGLTEPCAVLLRF